MAKIQFLLTMKMKDGVEPPSKKKNTISTGLVEILRLPDPGKRIATRVGEKVKGRLVVQYVGPLTIEIVSTPKLKKKAMRAKKVKIVRKSTKGKRKALKSRK